MKPWEKYLRVFLEKEMEVDLCSSYGNRPPANCGNPSSGGHHRITPSPPRGGGSGYYYSPPTSTPRITGTPLTPTVVIPPTVPSTPGISVPSPPFPFDPNSPPFTVMEDTAALLNSMLHGRFACTIKEVRDSFIAVLSSNNDAAAQAQLFKLANEGRLVE
ncbi:unnamed protein product [Fraxinus pennsylvanica]|uniref:Uncharacterized protein n=1 Tax=Fraxinus pennsylvanica TaxID=56036 RepID=A0AAD2AH66_9LAMI|nr:unnamed protein product [Fraxinus pennsylvanica]